ncbi:hypothetical protein ACIQD5_35655 [Streptomyces microflavus]|uniref:hypothetical protein n=1 Tax=Streptomyces microflavus TaxID=1919 RepID=UPI0037FC01C9
MQTYFQETAIEDAEAGASLYDQRLLLLRDGDDLVGAAVHYSESAPDDESGDIERRLAAYAASSHVQGGKLSTGEYASKSLLRAVISDIASRHSPQDMVVITALVLPMNKASRACLERYGWSNVGLHQRYIMYANSLQAAQQALDIDPSLGIDVYHGPVA